MKKKAKRKPKKAKPEVPPVPKPRDLLDVEEVVDPYWAARVMRKYI